MEQKPPPDDPDLIEVLDLIGATETPLQAFLDYLRGERRWPVLMGSTGDNGADRLHQS
jgi:hypothetical protein